MDKPFIKVMKLDAMNVIATSGNPEDVERPATLRGLSIGDSGDSLGF